MTRVFLAAGVAALAISAPASARPEREHGGQAAHTQRAERPQRSQRVERQQHQRVERQARTQRAERPQRQERLARSDRSQRLDRAQQAERQQRAVRAERAQRVERKQQRVVRTERQHVKPDRIDRQQVRVAERQRVRDNQLDRTQGRIDRQAMQIDRQQLRDERRADRQVLRSDNAMAKHWARIDDRRASRAALRSTRLAALDNRIATQFVAPVRVRTFIGAPVSTVSSVAPLRAVPSSISYLYPNTDDYYYRYGGGYMYRVDRDNDLIDWVLPLLAGGYMPGQYLPTSYMNSYVPNYYGFNSFYPSSYGAYGAGYGYGYDNLCNRYANGVVYQVNCATGLVEDVIPLYAGGYGVGQMLPSSYSYYNVPYQYRSMYYNTPDYNYWYAPGAIYQVDPATSLITSVAALLTPGLTVGQPLPVGYNMYNVPMAYRSTYYDTPNAWYRYNNGYIYQVDPATQLVTAIVASILT